MATTTDPQSDAPAASVSPHRRWVYSIVCVTDAPTPRCVDCDGPFGRGGVIVVESWPEGSATSHPRCWDTHRASAKPCRVPRLPRRR